MRMRALVALCGRTAPPTIDESVHDPRYGLHIRRVGAEIPGVRCLPVARVQPLGEHQIAAQRLEHVLPRPR
ncbi:hypothetical protein D3C83_174170 [compost metagenome]